MVNVKIKYLTSTAKLPLRGSNDAAGYDLYADFSSNFIEIQPHETAKINTGICIAIPKNYFGAILARSGLSQREGLRPCNCLGVVDADYRGEIIVALHNDHDTVRYITPGERIAQLAVLPFESINFEEVDNIDVTERNTGGFGSTGAN